jgi:hypothetical protein
MEAEKGKRGGAFEEETQNSWRARAEDCREKERLEGVYKGRDRDRVSEKKLSGARKFRLSVS